MDAKSNYYCWVVAYIDSDFLHLVKPQLARYPEYAEVEPYIPTVKVLKKKFKGKDAFDEIPLLFNYGFFKIPRKYAVHREYLDGLQRNISAIYGWVKDASKRVKNASNVNEWDDSYVSVATATAHEITHLIKSSVDIGAHSSDDITMLKPGDFITLKGYPFDGVNAEFVSVDEKKKRVKVKIIIFDHTKEVDVSYDNVFFTVYHGKSYDDSLTIKNSLDEMAANKTLDRFTNKHTTHENEC